MSTTTSAAVNAATKLPHADRRQQLVCQLRNGESGIFMQLNDPAKRALLQKLGSLVDCQSDELRMKAAKASGLRYRTQRSRVHREIHRGSRRLPLSNLLLLTPNVEAAMALEADLTALVAGGAVRILGVTGELSLDIPYRAG